MPEPTAHDGGDARNATAPVGGIGIAAVERDTGISKETLRVWERRYGFPAPWRDIAGERLYPPEQVQRLRLVKRLLDAGHRPGRVVAASAQDLAALLQPATASGLVAVAVQAPEIAAGVAMLQSHDIDGLRRLLSQAVLRRGLAGSIGEVFAPLTTRIGELWLSGALQVFEEHIYSESLQVVLRQAIHALPAGTQGGPRVLLTTLPGESHALPLLMAEALLSLEGSACLSLGVQTPLAELPAAAAACRADIVALSFSGQLPNRAVLDGLAALRAQLPAGVEIWVGGGSRAPRLPNALDGVHYLADLAAIASEMTRWRKLLESRL